MISLDFERSAAVNPHGLTRDELGPVARQEGDHAGHLLHGANPTQRVVLALLLHQLLVSSVSESSLKSRKYVEV